MITSMIGDIVAFFSLLRETIRLLKRVVSSIRELQSFEIDRLVEEINAGNLNYGDKVTVTGIFSEFVPIARKLMIPVEGSIVPFDPLPCRPFSIDGYYCASLQDFDSKFAADPGGFPLFFKDNTPRPILSTLSGLTVEIKGTLMSVQPAWKRLLDLKKPACINVQNIEIVGAEKLSFGIVLWAIARAKKDFLKPHEGSILHTDRFWWFTDRLGVSSRYLFMSGGPSKIRHGNMNEQFDTIHDFYGVNLLDEEEYDAHRSALEKRVGRRRIDAQFDMTTLPPENIRWLRKSVGF